MLGIPSRVAIAFFGLVPGVMPSWWATMALTGLAFNLGAITHGAFFLLFVWAVAFLFGYAGLWIVTCAKSPNRWLVRATATAMIASSSPAVMMVWKWGAVPHLDAAFCACPDIVAIAVLIWSVTSQGKQSPDRRLV